MKASSIQKYGRVKKRVLNSKRPSDVGMREEADLSDHSHISASKNTYIHIDRQRISTIKIYESLKK